MVCPAGRVLCFVIEEWSCIVHAKCGIFHPPASIHMSLPNIMVDAYIISFY